MLCEVFNLFIHACLRSMSDLKSLQSLSSLRLVLLGASMFMLTLFASSVALFTYSYGVPGMIFRCMYPLKVFLIFCVASSMFSITCSELFLSPELRKSPFSLSFC